MNDGADEAIQRGRSRQHLDGLGGGSGGLGGRRRRGGGGLGAVGVEIRAEVSGGPVLPTHVGGGQAGSNGQIALGHQHPGHLDRRRTLGLGGSDRRTLGDHHVAHHHGKTDRRNQGEGEDGDASGAHGAVSGL